MNLTNKLKMYAVLVALVLCLPPNSARSETASGAVYGRNIFAGAFIGGILGATTGLIPYASERASHDPAQIPFSAVYGAIGTAVLVAPLLSAYEIGSEKNGAGTTVLFSTMAFSLLGATAGAGYSMIDYQHQIGTSTENNGEIILWNSAYGAIGGAGLGLLTGLWEILVWRESDGLVRPPGSGIHANMEFLRPGTTLKGPRRARLLPHLKLAEIHF